MCEEGICQIATLLRLLRRLNLFAPGRLRDGSSSTRRPRMLKRSLQRDNAILYNFQWATSQSEKKEAQEGEGEGTGGGGGDITAQPSDNTCIIPRGGEGMGGGEGDIMAQPSDNTCIIPSKVCI